MRIYPKIAGNTTRGVDACAMHTIQENAVAGLGTLI